MAAYLWQTTCTVRVLEYLGSCDEDVTTCNRRLIEVVFIKNFIAHKKTLFMKDFLFFFIFFFFRATSNLQSVLPADVFIVI